MFEHTIRCVAWQSCFALADDWRTGWVGYTAVVGVAATYHLEWRWMDECESRFEIWVPIFQSLVLKIVEATVRPLAAPPPPLDRPKFVGILVTFPTL